MVTSKVDTFEHDIVDEIKRREATLAEISAVSKATSLENAIVPQKKPQLIVITLVSLFVIALIGIGIVSYYYFNDPLLPPSSQSVNISPNNIPKVIADLNKISPSLATGIGRFVTVTEKKERGYVLTIGDYSSVFAYMTRNEAFYINELSLLFSSVSSTTKALATPIVVPAVSTTTKVISGTSSQATSTKTSSSTKKTVPTASATSTQAVSDATSTLFLATTTRETEPKIEVIQGMKASDLTLANQNMRVFTSDGISIVYAFVGTTKLLIARTPEDILALKSAILQK